MSDSNTLTDAVLSDTFSLPPEFLEEKMLVTDLWDHHYAHSSSHPLFVYEKTPGSGETRTIRWSEAIRAQHRAGRTLLEGLLGHGGEKAKLGGGHLVGVIAMSDSLSAWAAVTGLIRAGFRVFLISPRNSPAAVAKLLEETDCRLVVASNDLPTRELLRKSLDRLPEPFQYASVVTRMPTFGEVFIESEKDFVVMPPLKGVSMDDVAVISHSSGSTSFPKPRNLTHRILVKWALTAKADDLDLGGQIMAAHCLPFFHAMGFCVTTLWPATTGVTIAALTPSSPPMIPTPDHVLNGTVVAKANIMLAIPTFFEQWCNDGEALRKLSMIDLVWFSGGPLSKNVGDTLRSKGITIRTVYGLTELGMVSALTKTIPNDSWEYMKIGSYASSNFVRQDGPEDVYELVVTDSYGLHPCVFNTELDGKPALASGDLFLPHPEDPTLWKIHGRIDDQIMHSTGEKTNPGPLERIIADDPAVKYAVMFGRARFQTGVIIEPSNHLELDRSDTKEIDAFVEKIWPAIEKANAFAPTHSRIFREMVIISHPSKPFKLTQKRTLQRSEIVKDYAGEIDAAYRALDVSQMKDLFLPDTWSLDNCVQFLERTVGGTLGHMIGLDDDFFQSGADSLQATYLKHVVLHALRQSQIDISGVDQNLIYTYPTIPALARYISSVAIGGATNTTDVQAAHVKEMQDILQSLTYDFPVHNGTHRSPEAEAIIVTGTTGSLGSLLLETLVSIPSVNRVYAFNRPSRSQGTCPRDRHLSLFAAQGINASVLDSPKVVLLEGDLASPCFGLSEEVFETMRSSVTSIIHTAWTVDFKLSVASFKPQLLGVRGLIEFALSSSLKNPPTIVFTSSISDLQNRQSSGPVPEILSSDPLDAVGIGYGESKWIASRLLQSAQAATALSPVIVRVGQLCGNSRTGNWNPWEWFPSIVRSWKALGCLPDINAPVTWLPVDVAASAIADVRSSDGSTCIINLVHPSSVAWHDIITPLSTALNVPVVPYEVWLHRLTCLKEQNGGSLQAEQNIPALKLYHFYANLDGAPGSSMGMEAMNALTFDVTSALRASETLRDPGLKLVGEADALKWVKFWMASRFS